MATESSRLASQYKQVLEAVPDATIVADRVGRIVFANACAEALFGFGAGELVGKVVEALVPPRFRGSHESLRNHCFQSPPVRPTGAGLELYGVRKDGSEFPAEISVSPLETDDGVLSLTAIRDVTERKKVESKFRGLLAAAPDAMVIAGASGRIVLVNARAEELFGYGRDELLGQLVEALIPPRFRRTHRGHRSGYFVEPRARPMGAGGLALFGQRKDGTEFPVEISLSPLETEDGTLAMTAIRDITDRKRVEEERAKLNARLEALLADQNRFFTNVSHEIRTPLSLILGVSQRILAAAEPSSAAHADLEVVVRNARMLLRHVNDLLDVAKLQAGAMQIQRAAIDVPRLVRLVASHFEAVAAERMVALRVDVPESLVRVVDGPKIQRVLLNLLSNAFKASAAGGIIRCSARAAAGPDEPPDGLVLEVADAGPGIRPQDRDSVFERFHQLDVPGRAGGTGLGLAIVKEFVGLHDGSVAIGDAPEGGALFRVVLPRLEAAAAAVDLAADEARDVADALHVRPAPPTSAALDGAPLVLVVEDNPDMSRFIRDSLAADASVVVASGGREGLERALATPPDLVVTDLMMAQGTGEELIRALRERRELDDVPVVVLTAKGDDELRVRLLREGAQDYVLKPFAADELRARVGGLLATKRTRDLLRAELASQGSDLETLVRELAMRKRQLEASVGAAQAARDEAERAARVKANFLSLVSHELRTPLAVMRLQLDLLSRDPGASERQRSALPRIEGAGRRLTALVEALLEQARVTSGRMPLRRDRVDLGELVAECVEELRPQAEAKGLALRVASARDLEPIATDPRVVALVVTNLVGNAVKFTEAGGVEVNVFSVGEEHHIAVSDSGPGIPESERERIFEPFEQIDPVSSKHRPGVGLGLALARELCSMLGSRIELASRVGAGSTFTVVLPPGAAGERAEGLGATQPSA